MLIPFGEYRFGRYPRQGNKSLKPWSAVDEHLLFYLESEQAQFHYDKIGLVEDHFGFLACVLAGKKPLSIISYKSQERGILKNMSLNGISKEEHFLCSIVEPPDQTIDLGLIKIPKSLDLFEYYLRKLHDIGGREFKVLAGFMTKYFTKSMLEVANKYFGSVEQSRAFKKSRLLILSEPKDTVDKSKKLLRSFHYGSQEYNQHYGVFAKEKIDLATRFLLENLPMLEGQGVDLACGNGIIGNEIQRLSRDSHITYIDDFILAIESAKLNCDLKSSSFIWDNGCMNLPGDNYDFVVTNPPFHFGHEIDINVSLGLFEEAHSKLRNGGKLVIVANQHLNYSTHLSRYFSKVVCYLKNDRFEIIEAVK